MSSTSSIRETDFTMVEVEFPNNLRYGRTATIVVRYDLLGDPPRTETSWVRVNPAYVSFPMIAYADPGAADVRVEIPDDWTPEYSGTHAVAQGPERRGRARGTRRRRRPTSSTCCSPPGRTSCSTPPRSRSPDPTSSCGRGPATPRWAQFARRHVDQGLPVLERLTGTPWPEQNETDVIEASTPYLRGYAGYYYADTDVIEVDRGPRRPHDAARALARLVQRHVPLRPLAERRAGGRDRRPRRGRARRRAPTARRLRRATRLRSQPLPAQRVGISRRALSTTPPRPTATRRRSA